MDSRSGLLAPRRRGIAPTRLRRLLLAPLLLLGLPAAADFDRLGGTFADRSDARYEGPTLARAPHGAGRLVWPDGRVYEGTFVDGLPHGEGKVTWPDGLRFEGAVSGGRIAGEGRVWFVDGRRYRGPLDDGRPHGVGTMRWPDRARYTGEYHHGLPHGWGEHKAADGARYVGGFERGARMGQGTLIAADGALFRGRFQGGRRHGRGVKVGPRGKVFLLEVWEHGERVASETIRVSGDCRLSHADRRWMVRDAECAAGVAEGDGHAVSTDGTMLVVDARFRGGRLAEGRVIVLGQPESDDATLVSAR